MLSKQWFLALAVLAVAFPSVGISQSKASAPSKPGIVGTWRLVSVHSWRVNNVNDVNRQAYGPHPHGLITYTADGRMSVIETYDGRKPLSADREAASMEERAEAFSTMVAYAGSYTLLGNRVVHHVEVSASPGPTRDQVRFFRFQGPDRVVLRTSPVMRNGVAEIHEMFWVRVK